jgi:RNA polymerase sigma factor (TIGR02999 family)
MVTTRDLSSSTPPGEQPGIGERVASLLEAASARSLTAEELLPAIYDDLRGLAQRELGDRERTLQATSLVHEAWMRVLDRGDPGWDCRAHFFGAAARAMRRILVEDARRKASLRHGGGVGHASLPTELPELEADVTREELLSLDMALDELEQRSPLQARIVSLRFFSGLPMADIGELLGEPLKRVEREWAFARAWLEREMRRGESDDTAGSA